MPADAKRLQSIFLAAIEADDRAAVLDRECGGDADLRKQVERLLATHDDSAELPAAFAPTGDYASAAIEKLAPGSVFAGRYKLREQLGEGGMGVVYVADQIEPVQRRVALKIIRANLPTEALLARFEQERQALALMDHPNIAKVYDAGVFESPSPSPIQGEGEKRPSGSLPPCGGGLGWGGTPYFVMELIKGLPITKYCDDAKLTPKQRLELFIPVCQAVQHAHQKGIIHRDLKPANIIVGLYDGKPVPKVIDFGVAKVTGPRLTEHSVYTEVGSIIGTLEYMSPEQAELNNLDIDTRTDIYALGVILYELLTGTVPFSRKEMQSAGFGEMLRIIKEQEPSKPSTKLSGSGSLPSVAACRHTEPAKLTRLVRGELDWITMKALEKDRTRRYETANGLAMDIERYLNDEPVLASPPSAAYRVRKFVRRNKAGVTAAAFMALLLVSGIAATSWQAHRAELARLDAVANEQRANDERDRADQEKQTAQAVLDFVENKVFAAARPKDQEGGQGYDVKLADAITAALPHVEKSFTDQPLIEARLRMTLGDSFLDLGKADVAERQYRRARDLFSAKLGPDHLNTLGSMNNLAVSYEALGRHSEALTLREETLRLMQARFGPNHVNTLGSMNNLANSYADLGRFGEATKLYEETLAIMKAKIPDDQFTLNCMNNLATTYAALGRHSEALALREETVKLMKAKLGPNHPVMPIFMAGLANSYAALGRHTEALTLREETHKLAKEKLGLDHLETLRSMNNLAESYFALRRHAEALALREETLKLKKLKLGLDHPDTLEGMNNLAESLFALGRQQEALALREETVKLQKAKLGANHPATVATIYDIVRTHALMIAKADDRAKQADLAMNWLQKAVAAGYKNIAHMKKDTDLDPLRDREDFKKLIAELEAKAPAEKK